MQWCFFAGHTLVGACGSVTSFLDVCHLVQAASPEHQFPNWQMWLMAGPSPRLLCRLSEPHAKCFLVLSDDNNGIWWWPEAEYTSWLGVTDPSWRSGGLSLLTWRLGCQIKYRSPVKLEFQINEKKTVFNYLPNIAWDILILNNYSNLKGHPVFLFVKPGDATFRKGRGP